MWSLLLSPALALPALDEPARTGASSPRDSAVVVGIEDYFVLPDVPYAARDADAFYDFAVYTRGIPSDRVALLDGAVSREKFLAALTEAGKRTGAGGTVFVYFAGHGAASPSTGERVLVGADAQGDLETFEARAVPLTEVRNLATAGGGNAVLVLDTCYSGKSRGGAELVAGKRFAVPAYAAQPNPKVVEWTAAGPDQWSGPLDAARHGAFTYLAIGALRGWADGQRDGQRDGQVTVEEASLYVEEGLRALQIRDQRPERVGDGGLVLSRGTEARPALDATSAAIGTPAAGTPATQAPGVAAAPAALPSFASPGEPFGKGPGQLQLASLAMVAVLVDGVLQQPTSQGVYFLDQVSPGQHQLEIRSAVGKLITESPVVIPEGTQLRLRYKDKALSELGRGPLTEPPPAEPAGVAPAVATTGQPVFGKVAKVGQGAVSAVTESRILGTLRGRTAAGGGGAAQMTPAEAAEHLGQLDRLSFTDEQLQYVAWIATNYRPTCAQVGQFVEKLMMDDDRVTAASYFVGRVTDPENAGLIVDALKFSDGKDQVRQLYGLH